MLGLRSWVICVSEGLWILYLSYSRSFLGMVSYRLSVMIIWHSYRLNNNDFSANITKQSFVSGIIVGEYMMFFLGQHCKASAECWRISKTENRSLSMLFTAWRAFL